MQPHTWELFATHQDAWGTSLPILPQGIVVYGIKRRERLRGNLSAILNIDGQLHPMLMNTNDVDEHRDTATCVADLIPSGAMLAWVVLFHDWIWLWDSHALSWRLLKLQPC